MCFVSKCCTAASATGMQGRYRVQMLHRARLEQHGAAAWEGICLLLLLLLLHGACGGMHAAISSQPCCSGAGDLQFAGCHRPAAPVWQSH